jgi:photosystem II stability/assembly factor-like uncharacterized protein
LFHDFAGRACASTNRFVRFLGIFLISMAVGACGGGGGGTSPPPPPAFAISSQPVDTSVTAGEPATFHVAANLPATFQWQREDVAGWVVIDGATSADYSVPAAQASENGTKLRVIVTAQGGAASILSSSAVTLTVLAAPQPPAITVAAADQTLIAGGDATFSITASGTALAYRWQRSSDGLAWSDIDGATTATLVLPRVALADDGSRLRVIVANALGSTTGAVALLHVVAAPVAPTFTAVPADTVVVDSHAVTFTVAVSGTPTPTLAWQTSGDGIQWSTLPGETGASLVLASVSLADSGKHFRAVANNASGQVESPGALLTVAPQPVAAFISTSPADVSVGAGATPSFHVAAGGTPGPTFQWQVSTDGGVSYVNVNGATAADLTLAAVSSADNGKRVRAVATNATASVSSGSALLTVRPGPQITQQPESQAWRTGLPTPTFMTAATGSGLTYRWQMRTAGAASFSDIAGATGSSVTIAPPTVDAQVRAIVTDAVGDSTTSAAAMLSHLHWAFVSPVPTGDEMFSLRWLDSTTVLAVGIAGSVIRSTDAGLTWSVVTEMDAAHAVTLLSLATAPSGQTAVAVGVRGVVRRSTDGGLHWLTVRGADANLANLVAVSFVDATTVVAASADGSMLRSVDAGQTWTAVSTGQTDPLEAMDFRAGVGIAVTSHGTLLRSINGGAQWSTITNAAGIYSHKLSFVSDSVVIVAQAQGVERSADAGLTWQNVPADTYFFPGDIAFSDDLHGFELPSNNGAPAFATSDGGLTWTSVPSWPLAAVSNVAPRLDSVRFGPGGVGLATGFYGLLMRTTDGGQTWTRIDVSGIPDHEGLRSVAFVTATSGVAVSSTQLYRTSDAGLHWSRLPVGDHSTGPNTWSFVRALDAVHLLAVDLQGNVLGSDDGGATWTSRTSTRPIVADGNGEMAFADSTFGMLVTGDGYIQRTTDAGATWTTVYTPPSFDCFNDVAVVSRSVAVVADCAGSLMRTTDGGTTWTQVRDVIRGPAWVTFSDANNGIATDSKFFSGTSAHTFQRTRDGGATWQDVNVPSTTFNFGKPWFVSATEGFVGEDNGCWHTTDGGNTWTFEATGRSFGQGVALDANTSMSFGARGAVMLRTN